jgi:hypothetical protein
MEIHPKQFRVSPGANVKLKRWPTQVDPFYKSKAHYHEILADHV